MSKKKLYRLLARCRDELCDLNQNENDGGKLLRRIDKALDDDRQDESASIFDEEPANAQ